jgi:hypothetical protein
MESGALSTAQPFMVYSSGLLVKLAIGRFLFLVPTPLIFG